MKKQHKTNLRIEIELIVKRGRGENESKSRKVLGCKVELHWLDIFVVCVENKSTGTKLVLKKFLA
jgi:hypothetical protein